MLDWLMQQKGVGLLVFDIVLCATGWKHWSTRGGFPGCHFLSQWAVPEKPRITTSQSQQHHAGWKEEEENPNAHRESKENKKYYIRIKIGSRSNKLANDRKKEESPKWSNSWWPMHVPNLVCGFSQPPHNFYIQQWGLMDVAWKILQISHDRLFSKYLTPKVGAVN